MSIATQLEQWREPVEQVVSQTLAELEVLKTTNAFDISLMIMPDGSISITPCLPATVAFGIDDPEHLGVVEYQSASRSYTRQQLGGINLDSRAFRQNGDSNVFITLRGSTKTSKPSSRLAI
jgi:hypothetical protein